MEKQALKSREAEAVLGLATGTLAAWRARQEPEQPPYCRIGRRTIRYRRDDLEAYLQQRRIFAGEASR